MQNWHDKKEELAIIPLPEHGKRYGCIPHTVFLDEIQEHLDKKGYKVAEERYLTASGGQILTGNLRIQNESDLEMMPSINFVNSYNRSRKASIRVTGMVLVCKNGMMSASKDGHYSRKHIGEKALPDFRKHLELAINGLDEEFARLLKNKQEMKEIELHKKIVSQLVGDMILNEELINSTQISILKKEIKFSEHFKGNSLWDFYNHTTEAFKSTHPSFYDKQHVKFHSYITDKFDLSGSRGLYGEAIEFTEPIPELVEEVVDDLPY